jgi:hypothetical protein
MENRLCLNKKPVYELPGEVLIELYEYQVKDLSRNKIPDFEPDICINIFGCLGVKEPRTTAGQYWIKSNNKELLKFIENYDFEKLVKNKITNAYTLPLWQLKKIILEEFYNKK